MRKACQLGLSIEFFAALYYNKIMDNHDAALGQNMHAWFIFIAALTVAMLILFYGGAKKRNARLNPSVLKATHIEPLLAHRARYEISLRTVKSASTIKNLQGTLDYTWQPDCGGVASSYQFDTLYDYGDGRPALINTTIALYEHFTQPRLDFSLTRTQKDAILDSFRGYSDLDTGKAHYQSVEHKSGDNEETSLTLPDGAIFPTQHSLALLRAIKEKRSHFFSALFDGSDADGLMLVSSVIGRAAEPAAIEQELLSSSPAHHVRMAFFQPDADQMRPDYEMDATFHENGVMRNVNIEYDNFSITQALTLLEALPNGCDQEEKQ